MNPLIRAAGLSKHYAPTTEVLKNLNFEIQAPSFTILMGTSGAGKSTLLNVLAGLDSPSDGEFWYNEMPMHTKSERDWAYFRRKNIGMVFQDHNLIPYLTLLENTVLAGLLGDSNRKAITAEAMTIFSELSIGQLAHRLPNEVSGGERQRAAIARALINKPGLIIADEPTGSLNDKASNAVLGILRALFEKGQNILLATHDLNTALMGTEVLLLSKGHRLTRWKKPNDRRDIQSQQLFLWLKKQGW